MLCPDAFQDSVSGNRYCKLQSKKSAESRVRRPAEPPILGASPSECGLQWERWCEMVRWWPAKEFV